MKLSAKAVTPALLAALMLLSACGSSLKAKLVGRWNNAAHKTVWEFKSDGSIRVTGKDSNGQENLVGEGKYNVIDAETIDLRLGQQPGKANVQSLPQSELKISAPGALSFVLTPLS